MVLAPKLSALQKQFSRKDFTVVALYMETCDGVDDHTAEFRRQAAALRDSYPALDAEAGKVIDPTRKQFPWAPHALLVDRRGRIVRTYGYIPRMRVLREDIASLVATDVFPVRPDDPWREFQNGAWIETLSESGGVTTRSKTVLERTGCDWTTIRRDGAAVRLIREPKSGVRDFRRTARDGEKLRIDGRTVNVRVFDSTWKRGDVTCRARRWIANGIVVRERRTATKPDGTRTVTTKTLNRWAASVSIAGTPVECRVFTTTTQTADSRVQQETWHSSAVPGHVVMQVRRETRGGKTVTRSKTVVAFGIARR